MLADIFTKAMTKRPLFESLVTNMLILPTTPSPLAAATPVLPVCVNSPIVPPLALPVAVAIPVFPAAPGPNKQNLPMTSNVKHSVSFPSSLNSYRLSAMDQFLRRITRAAPGTPPASDEEQAPADGNVQQEIKDAANPS